MSTDTVIDMTGQKAAVNHEDARRVNSMNDASQTVQVAKTPIRLPTFLTFDVELWHQQCQAAFQIHGINDERSKYFQALASLQAEVVQNVTAYITEPDAGHEFAGLVEALSFAYSKSDAEKYDELFNKTLGDKKPSQLYYHMRRLWLDDFPDKSKVLRQIFIRKLPPSVAVLLRSITNIDLKEFLRAADDMVDQHNQQGNMMIARQVNVPQEDMTPMEPKAADRAKTISKSWTNKNKSSNQWIESRRYNDDGICNYHVQYGEKAFKCRPGCKFISKGKVNSISNEKIILPESWNRNQTVKLNQQVDGKNILVDTGSTFSLVPARPEEKKRRPNNNLFKGAQGLPIAVYGQKVIVVDIGTGRNFKHKFFIADVEDPLLGMDFLLEHRLVVDPVNNKLFDVDTFQSARVNVVLNNSITSINENEIKGKLQYLWKEFPSLCDASVSKLSSHPKHNIVHDILLKEGTKPTAAKARRMFGPKLEAARNEIDTMLKLGIIRPSKSEWASPLHVVPKGDGSFRPCGDFRELNAATIPDRYPLPHIQDFTAHLKHAKVFSKIDLVRAFHQIPLSQNAIPKTAITTPFGLFEFVRMPFGLCNAAQAFQRFINMVTNGLEGVYVYIDDILVIAENIQEHETRLRKLFARLNDHGLIVNPAKSVLGTSEVQYLGFVVNSKGIKPMDKKVKAIQNFPTPTKYGQLSEFLGMANFYHRFIPNCSATAKPLYELLKTNNIKKTSRKPISISAWKKEHESAFLKLKKDLANSTMLSFPDQDALTRLVTDASDTAIGAVLEQFSDESWKPVAFHSKLLRESEKKYSAYDRELLAIKISLIHFKHIIEGISPALFHVATDHKPLTTGKNFRIPHQSQSQLNRISRTWELISELTTDIRHISGKDNCVADAISRNAINRIQNKPILALIAEEQENIGMRPSDDANWPQHWQVEDHFGYKLTVDTRSTYSRPVVPDKITKDIFHHVHDLAHTGVKATKKSIASSYIWPNMAKQITEWVKECHVCQATKIHKHNKTPLASFPAPSGKFQDLHVDIVGPFPPSNEHTYLLTVIDRFSRWPGAYPMKAISAEECARTLLEGWIQNYGTPLNLTTDRGRQFTSNLWKELCNLIGTTHNLTTAYHPQTNGLVERFHRQLKSSLMARSKKNTDWLLELPVVMLGLRTAIKEDLETSPAHLVYGEPLRIPAAFFPKVTGKKSSDPITYLTKLEKAMAEVKYTKPSWHGRGNDESSLHGLQDCTHVYVLQPGLRPSMQKPYKGPYKVLQKTAKTFTIQLPGGQSDKVSLDRLKPAFTSSEIAGSNDGNM